MKYRTSLIGGFDEAEVEQRLTDDLNFAADTWNAEVVTIQFSTTPYDEAIWYSVVFVCRITTDDGEAQS